MRENQYARNLELLYETPQELSISLSVDKRRLHRILERALKERREILTEPESKEFLEAYGIPTAKTYVAKTPKEAVSIASKIGYPVVLKVFSSQITHKTDVGGVVLGVTSSSQVEKCFEDLINRVRKSYPMIKIDGVTVQPMIEKNGYELIIGSKRDPLFGSVIIFGTGGIGVELFNDVAVEFPPLNQTLARGMIERTKVYKLLKGYRNRRPANIRLLEEILVKFSQLITVSILSLKPVTTS